MPAFPPPRGRPASAFFTVIARASRATSPAVTSGLIRDAADRRAQRHAVDHHDGLYPGTGTEEGDQCRAQLIDRPAGMRLLHPTHLP
jgi:hypothetical protein